MKPIQVALTIALLIFTPLIAVSADLQPAGNPAMADAIAAFEQATGVTDYSFVVRRGKDTLFRAHRGRFDASTQIPVASASKWLVAATTMTLVDAGKLDLGIPVARWLPELPDEYGALTLQQLLSFTAGLPDIRRRVEVTQPSRWSLLQSALDVASHGLVAKPGSSFAYGGGNLQIVGAAIERAAGRSWGEYFDLAIAAPLGMTRSVWSHPGRHQPGEGHQSNPVLQGGLITTLEDYERFLGMIAAMGAADHRTILSTEAFADLEAIRTDDVEMQLVPPGMGKDAAYLLAHWCERRNQGRCERLSSPGAFGTYPWVDRPSGIYGLMFTRARLRETASATRVLIEAAINTFDQSTSSEL